MPCRQVLVVGDWTHRDFRETIAWLETHTRLTRSTSVAAALAELSREPEAVGGSTFADAHGADKERLSIARRADGQSPDVANEPGPGRGNRPGCDSRTVVADRGPGFDAIVIAQSNPGQIRSYEIERLHAASPLSRLVVLAGSWCEGELRSGRPSPGVIRILWHQWQPRLTALLDSGSTDAWPLWQIPRTASLDERLACTVDLPWPARSGLIAIYAAAHETFAALSDVCCSVGYATIWQMSEQPLAAGRLVAVLADGISCDDVGIAYLRRVVRCHRPAPVVALLDYVRRQDYDLAISSGVSAVLAKPFLVYDLLWNLEQAIASRSRAERD